MAQSTKQRYIYLVALILAILVFIFNVIFNVKSTHHHITTFLPDNILQHNQPPPITSNNSTNSNNAISNTTNYLLNIINHKLEQHQLSDTKKSEECNLLFCDKHKFDLMVSYYASISALSYPASWIELNDQLLCPVKYSSFSNEISFAGERLLKYIYSNQFKIDCNDPNNKYLFYDTTGWFTGLGATTNGGIIKYFTRSLMSNRTFILTGDWTWAQTKHCQQLIESGHDRKGFKCYFLPTSNCKYEDIMKHVDINNATEYRKVKGVPKDCNVGDFPDKPWCKERVLYIKNHGAGWYPKNEDIDKWIHNDAVNNNLIFANFQQYKAVIISFVYRLQPNVREIIYDKVRSAFIKSFETEQEFNDKFDPFQTIGFPIRASDKCKDNIMGIHGEMECWTVEELDKLLYSIHYLKPTINSVIFTSEDMHFVDSLIDKINNNGDYIKEGFKWNIIINHEDTRPGIGSAKYRDRDYHGLDIDKNGTLDTDFEHDVIVGALSSLLLQTSNSKYIVHTKSSSWLDNLWTIGSQLNCESLFWSQQIQIKGFSDNNDNIPSFLHNNNRKYRHFNKLCFELKQQGLLNKKTKWKHILYPPDIWEQIHVLNLNPKRFRDKFGIDISEKGWSHFCKRYTEPPFVLNLDVGI